MAPVTRSQSAAAATLPPAPRTFDLESVYDFVPLPLGNTLHVRVVRIRPSTTFDASDPIVCDFSVIDIDYHPSDDSKDRESNILAEWPSMWDNAQDYAPPEAIDTTSLSPPKMAYIALSYAWGNSSADHIITLHDKPFTVRKNLWDFLSRARKERITDYLWIDALCIDQTRVQERNHQVSVMGEIYSRAQRVIVWLGVISRSVEDALVAGQPEEVTGRHKKVSAEHIPGIEEFCELIYWKRAWIVQEYVLAEEIDIWYGQSSIHESMISFLFRGVWPGGIRVKLKASSAMKIHNFREEWLCRAAGKQTPADPFSPERKSYGPSERVVLDDLEFADLLGRIGSNLQCTDVRDRVYALLSLLSPAGREQISITPDYSKSAPQLFVSLASHLRECYGPLGVSKADSKIQAFQAILNIPEDDPVVRETLFKPYPGKYQYLSPVHILNQLVHPRRNMLDQITRPRKDLLDRLIIPRKEKIETRRSPQKVGSKSKKLGTHGRKTTSSKQKAKTRRKSLGYERPRRL
jgi:hypothetical protein